jgi:RHS repeat-associated protein
VDTTPSDPNGKGAGAGGDSSDVSAPAISSPKGGGAIRGMGEKFTANLVNGTGSMTVPIATSPTRSGFGPRLSLAYDSGAGNGPFGFGWTLLLPSIARKTDKGLPQYRDAAASDIFIISGAEDLVPALIRDEHGAWVADEFDRGGHRVKRYRPRVESLFARVERWTRLSDGDTHWRSISKENVLTVYGFDGDSRIADPADPRRIFSWLICQSYDDRGNAIVYDYAAENDDDLAPAAANEQNRSRGANRYLKRIRYGNRQPLLLDTTVPGFRKPHLPRPDFNSARWMFEVVFDYGEGHYREQAADAQGRVFARAAVAPPAGAKWPARRDAFSSYRSTFEVRTLRLCRRVLLFHHFPAELAVADYLVRSTEFDYDEKPSGSFVRQVIQSGFGRQPDGRYLKSSMPSLEFNYTTSPLEDPAYDGYEIKDIDADSLADLPAGVDDRLYRWVDLDGEGMPGILSEQGDAWFYKPNVGEGHFGPAELVATRPSIADLNGAHQQLLDLAGDGNLDMVELARTPGFYERLDDNSWRPFHSFAAWPNLAWADPNLRLVDLTGDGHADVLFTEDECLTWHPSLAEDGFGPALRVRLPHDEEKGPRVIFADATQAVYMADLSGDGLTDLLRVRNGEVCYWPNLGYGHFGPKVTMDNAPWFDRPDQFDQRRIRLVDTDGSGTTDIIYLSRDGVRIYLNESGNAWSEARVLSRFPSIDDHASIAAVDLLGRGTACLYWSSPLPGAARRPVRYVDLMNGRKPHLLVNVRNHLGLETRIEYASSTEFYAADKAAGTPWVTRLPFPVQVVARVETYDHIGRNRFVTRYTYHHGYFDGIEREFRGFGRVEQFDTEEFAALTQNGDFPVGDNIDALSHVPPALTKTWFHTGAYFPRQRISRQFEDEYYREGDTSLDEAALTQAQLAAMLLDDTTLPGGLTADETREACRTLKGSILRREVYALDAGPESARPYAVSERNYDIRLLQPRTSNPYAVFLAQPRESIDFHFERKLYAGATRRHADPRVSHKLTLAADDFGNALLTAAVAYGRRFDDPDPLLTAADRRRQKRLCAVFTVNAVTNPVAGVDVYRAPALSETRVFELVNVAPASTQPGITNLFRFDELAGLIAQTDDGLHDLPYRDVDANGVAGTAPFRRLFEHRRNLYRRNDLTGALPLHSLESLALPFESHRLAFTSGLANELFVDGGKLTAADLAAVLADEGKYVHSEGDSDWWSPSLRVFYSADAAHTPAQELTEASQHFFLARRYRDPLGHTTTVAFDAHDLLIRETRDALDNRVTAGERDAAGNLTGQGNDYHALQPAMVMDANRNRHAVAFNALGMVVGTAVMGKPEENQGDSLEGFEAELTDAALIAHTQNPFAGPQSILQRATTRLVYDHFAFARNEALRQPACVYLLVRETHHADLPSGRTPNVQHSFTYSDGFGREIQKKTRAAPGPLVEGGAVADPRWVGTGWVVFDNKGNPVREYEPFFDDTHAFKFGNRVGVSPILFYDPFNRVVGRSNPNRTWEKTILDPWRRTAWDVNDTVVLDPKTDADVGYYFRRLPDAAYLPTWYTPRRDGTLGADEQDGANKSAVHAQTPGLTFFDVLGRSFLHVTHNRFKYTSEPSAEEFQRVRVAFDIEGNERSVVDAADRLCARYDYDMLSNRVRLASMEAGERSVLLNVVGKPIRAWDARGHVFTLAYDALRRPLLRRVRGTDAAESDPRTLAGPVVFEKLEYGEGLPGDVASNLRTRLVRSCDGAGMSVTDLFDFKGNSLRSVQSLAQDYRGLPDWAGNPPLEPNPFVNLTAFDALNRVLTITTRDNSVAHVGYDEGNRLKTLAVDIRGASATAFVGRIDYDAKGQRKRIAYGNGAISTYEYEPETFRLARMLTTRPAGGDAVAAQLFVNPTTLQDLRYTYDPAGNITKVTDAALQTIVFNGGQVDPAFVYNFDAAYRLIEAGGREHALQAAFNTPTDGSYRDYPFVGASQLHDFQALQNYSERYEYDATANLRRQVHQAASGGWLRTYDYSTPSQFEPAKMSNRLRGTTLRPDALPPTTEDYAYDLHGCVTHMPHLSLMRWNFKDMLSVCARPVANPVPPPDDVAETTYFVYSGAGVRVRKVTERRDGTRKSERVYLLNAELYREYGSDGAAVRLARETLHVTDDRRRIAVVETNTVEDGLPVATPAPVPRYQFSNHLGSVALELDGAGALISYEEFTPYGGTAFQAGRSAAEVDLKRYRYTGKERDEETGFSYHGARYYTPWLASWTSCDPEGLAWRRRAADASDASAEYAFPHNWNPYTYANNNPVVYIDPTGRFNALTLLPLLPEALLPVTAGIMYGLERGGVIERDWVATGESRLFDWWTIAHNLVPAAVGMGMTLLLHHASAHLNPEQILAISGGTATALAFIYELIERPFFQGVYNATAPGKTLGGLTSIHSVTDEGALEYRSNTVGDVVIGSIGGFTASYITLAAVSRPVAWDRALFWGIYGPAVGADLTAAFVYGGVLPGGTRETHRFNKQTGEFEPIGQRSDILDLRYRAVVTA